MRARAFCVCVPLRSFFRARRRPPALDDLHSRNTYIYSSRLALIDWGWSRVTRRMSGRLTVVSAVRSAVLYTVMLCYVMFAQSGVCSTPCTVHSTAYLSVSGRAHASAYLPHLRSVGRRYVAPFSPWSATMAAFTRGSSSRTTFSFCSTSAIFSASVAVVSSPIRTSHASCSASASPRSISLPM
jgi:hypothetical protein